MKKIVVETTRKTEVINVTQQLATLVEGMGDGLVFFSVPHTTAALIICEDDPELREDIIKVVENVFADIRPFRHIKKNNPNAEAHILSALAGTSIVVAIEGGQLGLGTYQNLLLVEMDGPQSREIRYKVLAEQGDSMSC